MKSVEILVDSNCAAGLGLLLVAFHIGALVDAWGFAGWIIDREILLIAFWLRTPVFFLGGHAVLLAIAGMYRLTRRFLRRR